MGRPRLPRHVGVIPDGNRRWADARGLPRREGYAAGVEPGLRVLAGLRDLGVEEVSVYGFTQENVRRPSDQVRAFRAACVELARRALDAGAGLLCVGDATSPLFPPELRPWAERRAPGAPRVNLVVNYGWRWDLRVALERARAGSATRVEDALGSREVSRVDLVIRWGGRRRLSGFLPAQTAYADLHVIDTLWPDAREEDLAGAMAWYREQDVTLGG